jgi:hypothetical protein
MLNWIKLAPFAALALVLGIAAWRINDAAYERGEAAANKICRDETVPAARAEERKICLANAKITERANAQDLADKDAVADRYRVQYDQLRRTYRAIPCVPVTNLAGVHKSGTGAIPPAGGNGVDAGDLLDFAARCQRRSDEFINARRFILDTWAQHDSTGRN